MLTLGLSYMAIMGYVPSMPNLLIIFNHEGMLNFIDFSIEMILYLFLYLLR